MKRVLGKGLEALIPGAGAEETLVSEPVSGLSLIREIASGEHQALALSATRNVRQCKTLRAGTVN